MKLEELNELDRAGFVEAIGWVFEHSPWVAEQAWADRPYAAIDFLHQAGVRYDFVVLDMAPVMAADDVTSLAPHVDGVIFVIRSEQTSARVAHAARGHTLST